MRCRRWEYRKKNEGRKVKRRITTEPTILDQPKSTPLSPPHPLSSPTGPISPHPRRTRDLHAPTAAEKRHTTAKCRIKRDSNTGAPFGEKKGGPCMHYSCRVHKNTRGPPGAYTPRVVRGGIEQHRSMTSFFFSLEPKQSEQGKRGGAGDQKPRRSRGIGKRCDDEAKCDAHEMRGDLILVRREGKNMRRRDSKADRSELSETGYLLVPYRDPSPVDRVRGGGVWGESGSRKLELIQLPSAEAMFDIDLDSWCEKQGKDEGVRDGRRGVELRQCHFEADDDDERRVYLP